MANASNARPTALHFSALTLAAVRALLPLPTSLLIGNYTIAIGKTFSISCSSKLCPDPIPLALQRYESIVFSGGPPSESTGLLSLLVSVDTDTDLVLDVNESYELVVPDAGTSATLHAATQWGALRGLETFSQLVTWSKDYTGTSNGSYTISMAPVTIQDAPRWQWRGVLIDSSRHFLPVPTICSILEAMSYNKLNVLHWHIVDDQSWPLISIKYPAFSTGAFAPDAVYSHADVTDIVKFAWVRGIMVIPEFDMPGHASIWGQGYPSLIISCATGETLLSPIPSSSSSWTAQTDDVYTTLDGLLAEFLPLFLFPPIVHLGGDEVFNTTCWNESVAVQAWMQEEGMAPGDMHAARDFFETRLQRIVSKNHSASTAFWEEVWNGNFSIQSDTVVNVWLNTTDIGGVLRSGRRCVSSYGLYLNRAQPQAPLVPVHYAFQDTWQDFYKLDPLVGLNESLTPSQLSLFLGEEVSQWSIQYSAANVLTSLWPRASAAAERMWSPSTVVDLASAETRIEAHSCRMVQRGIPSSPLGSSYCPTTGAPGLPSTPLWEVHVKPEA